MRAASRGSEGEGRTRDGSTRVSKAVHIVTTRTAERAYTSILASAARCAPSRYVCPQDVHVLPAELLSENMTSFRLRAAGVRLSALDAPHSRTVPVDSARAKR